MSTADEMAVPDMRAVALACAQADLRVFPVHTIRNGACSCGGAKGCAPAKHPIGSLVPRGVLEASTDPAVIRSWWDKMPDANIGIATGKASNLVVLDVDGRTGEATLADLEKKHGPLPPTWQVKTGKGRHLYFVYPKDAAKVKSVARSKLGLDVRADGGYVLAPPSLHASGHRYVVVDDKVAGANCPAWVVDYANGKLKISPAADGNKETGNVDPFEGEQTPGFPNPHDDNLAQGIRNTAPTPYSEAEETRLRSALTHIPANERDTWRDIGFALHSLDWGDKGFEIWTDWSRTCPDRFNEADQQTTWESFDRPYDGARITIGTLFHKASEAGWVDGDQGAPNGEKFKPSGEYEPVPRDAPELGKLKSVRVTRIFDGDGDGKYKNDRRRLAFAVACELARANIGDDFIARVLMTTKCGIYVQEKPGYRLPRTLARARAVALDPNLRQMNDDYSAGSVAGKFRVLRWMPDARYPYQQTCEFQTKTDFCSSTINPKIEVPKFDKQGKQIGAESKGRGGWWLGQDHRSEFDGIDFRPGGPAIIERPTADGRTLEIVNMFSGFSCLPNDAGEAGCNLFLAHVHDNICDGDKKLFAYVMDWMASGVQHLEDPDRSALSLRGDPGCGKGVFALGYGSSFGRHFLHATQREHVVKKFNSHQAESCLIFIDEALYSQIKGDAQILKTLTTERTKLLERKGIDPVPVNNYARLIFATNDKHPIMIEHNDRRYVAIYVRAHPDWAGLPDEEAAPIRKAYFLPILDQMNNGGREALLGVLLKRDISKFNAEAIPATKERALQKLLSAPAGDKIVIEFAQDGRLPCCTADRSDAARPYADRTRHDGLYPAMRASSGKALQYESDQDLVGILTGWGFRRDRDRYGTLWVAPSLTDLRARITKRYPAIVWDQNLTDWIREPAEAAGQGAADVGEATDADQAMDDLVTKAAAANQKVLDLARGMTGAKA